MTGMTIHQISSPKAAVLLALQKLTREQLDAALRKHCEQGCTPSAPLSVSPAPVSYTPKPTTGHLTYRMP
jgi:hypothetical protein